MRSLVILLVAASIASAPGAHRVPVGPGVWHPVFPPEPGREEITVPRFWMDTTPVTNNDYESLSFPGQPGTDYIEAQLAGDTVSTLASPSNDYTDV